MVHLKTEVATLRIYVVESGYEDRLVPKFSCTVHFISDHEAYICNGVGSLTRANFREIVNALKDKGYNIIRYERNLKMKKYE